VVLDTHVDNTTSNYLVIALVDMVMLNQYRILALTYWHYMPLRDSILLEVVYLRSELDTNMSSMSTM